MADYEDTRVTDLVINNMSQEKFEELKAAGELDPTQIYLTPTEASGGASLPDQTGNEGKFLQTNGSEVSWQEALVNQNQNGGIGIGSTQTISSGTKGISIGNNVTVDDHVYPGRSVAIGNYSSAGAAGTAVGHYATTLGTYSIALGSLSKTGETASYAIQLGLGTNNDSNTFKVANNNGNFEIMSADGTIPTDRYTTTPTTAGTYVPKLTIAGDGTATREWGAESGGASLPDQTDNAGKFLMTNGSEVSWGNALVNESIENGGLSIQGTNSIQCLRVASYNVAIGLSAVAFDGVSIGEQSQSSESVSVGYNANSQYKGVAIGEDTNAGAFGIALGGEAVAGDTEFVVGLGGDPIKIIDHTGLFPRERMSALVEVLPTAENGYTTVKNYGNGYVEISGCEFLGSTTATVHSIGFPSGYQFDTESPCPYFASATACCKDDVTFTPVSANVTRTGALDFDVFVNPEIEITEGFYISWEVRGMLLTE